MQSLARLSGVLADWRWVLAPASIALISRLFSSLLLVVFDAAHNPIPMLSTDHWPFIAWDGQWYVSIAVHGYHAYPIQSNTFGGYHDFAFYPLWPMLIRVGSLGGLLPAAGTAVVLANLLFVAAAIVLYRFFADRFNGRVALWATVLLAFNPAAYVFSMAYSESLFLLTAGLYFVNRYGRASPVFAFTSVLARVSGLAIGASALATVVRGGTSRRRLLAIVVATGLGFAAWWLFIWQLTGNPLGWFEGSPSWNRYQGLDSILREWQFTHLFEAARLAFLALMVMGGVVLLRRHLDLAVYSLTAILLSLAGAPASSMPRHAIVAFPVFAALADRLDKRLLVLLVIGFALAQVLMVSISFGPNAPPP